MLGVQPGTTELGTSLSKSVESSLPHFVEAAIEQLCLWASCQAVPLCDAEEPAGIGLARSTTKVWLGPE